MNTVVPWRKLVALIESKYNDHHRAKRVAPEFFLFLQENQNKGVWRRLMANFALTSSLHRNQCQPTTGIERMLRLYFVQQWFGLSDDGAVDALHDSLSVRRFVGVQTHALPTATTVLQFRRLLEQSALGKVVAEQVNAELSKRQLLMCEGTLLDASVVTLAPQPGASSHLPLPNSRFGKPFTASAQQRSHAKSRTSTQPAQPSLLGFVFSGT